MRLSTRARYALWLMLEVARQGARGCVALRDVSSKTNLSRSYLEQLARALRTARLLRARSGRAGGYVLARAAEEVTIGEIVEAAIGPINVVECVRDPAICLRSTVCECRWMYATINERIEQVLAQLTLADLVDEPHPDQAVAAPFGEHSGCPIPPYPASDTSEKETKK